MSTLFIFERNLLGIGIKVNRLFVGVSYFAWEQLKLKIRNKRRMLLYWVRLVSGKV